MVHPTERRDISGSTDLRSASGRFIDGARSLLLAGRLAGVQKDSDKPLSILTRPIPRPDAPGHDLPIAIDQVPGWRGANPVQVGDA